MIADETSKGLVWTGRGLSTLATLFLLMDGIMKIVKAAPVMEMSPQLEIPLWVIPGLGILLTVCTILYALPQTAVLGAILLTGYLGGALWTHLRMGGPAFPVAFPVIVGAILWTGLYLRDARVRALVPWRR